MNKIDAHQHFWNYSKEEYGWINESMPSIKRNFLASDLEPLLKENGFSGSIAIQARQHQKENKFLLEQAAKSEMIKGIVGWVNLLSHHVASELEGLAKYPIIKGVRHVIQDEKDPAFMQKMAFVDGVKLLDLFDLTYDLLIHEKQMPSAIKFLKNFTGQKIVLDHIGKPLIKERLTNNWKDSLLAMAEYPSLYIKISGLVTEANWNKWDQDTFIPFLDKVVEAFGMDRIMIGSDWPVCLLAADSYGSVIDIATSYFSQFSINDQEKVYGGNASTFYNL